MINLKFGITGVEAPPHAAAPQLLFKLAVTNPSEEQPIHAVLLHCQVRIESVKRSYTDTEKEKLSDLFGEPERWGQTLRSQLWTHTQVNVPAFTGSVTVALPVMCTYDLNVVGTKYFYALEAGEVPLVFLFSGTVFYQEADGCLQAGQISWNSEAMFRLPVRVWQDMIECHYPNTNWLLLHRDTFDRLYSYKLRHGLPTWEQTVDRLLNDAGSEP